MAAQTITPAAVTATMALVEVAGSVPPAGEEWSLDARATNQTAADVLVRLALGPTGNPGAAIYRAYDLRIPANDVRDLERQLVIPAGYALYVRASAAAALVLSITGRKRATA